MNIKELKKVIVKKDNINYFVMLVSIIALALTCTCASPFWKGILHNDYCVFQIMGKALLNNKIIYKDLFDHKGPIMYVINAVGVLIGERYGILIVETILLFIGAIFIYKTSKIFLSNINSLLVSILYIAFIFIPISNGNYTEDYSCVFSAIGLYYVIRILYKNEIVNKKSWFMVGLTFALNLFIKPTYISLWMAFAIIVIIKLVKNSQIKELFKGAIFAFIGITVVTVPIFLYMIINNCMIDFWNAYIVMNIKYSNSTIAEKVTSFYKLLVKTGYLYLLILMIFGNIVILFNKKIKLDIVFFIGLFFIFTIVLTAMAPNLYQHYLIQCATMLATETAFVLYSIKPFREGELSKVLYYFIIIDIVLITFLYNYKNGDTIFNRQRMLDAKELTDMLDNVSTIIKSDEYECISIGNYPYVYVRLNKYPQYKYFFQFPIGIVDKSIGKETLNYINERRPKVIINASIGKRDLELVFGQEFDKLMNELYDIYTTKHSQYYILKQD